MYDDLSSLTAKLQMSGVAFQQMDGSQIDNTENDVTVTHEHAAITSSITCNNEKSVNRQEGDNFNALSPVSKVKHKFIEPQVASVTPECTNLGGTYASGNMEGVVQKGGATSVPLEEHSVRLDILFKFIGK